MYIHVTVTPDAKKESITEKTEKKEHYFDISVKEPARENRANRRIIELISAYFRVPIGKVKIINGHRHRKKLISVEMSFNN